MSNVSGAVKSIQDIMRKDVGVDGDAQRISQMVWMIFLKIYDDREEELELTEDDFSSPIPERFRWRNWAKDREGITGDELVKFIDELFFALKSELPTIGEVGKRAQVIRDVFEDTYNYMKSGTLMRQVVNKINEIDFNSTHDRHTFGAIYEQILKDLQSAGNAGEFYTPRAVTKFIIDRLAPKLDEIVFDPACGTGGFLACTIDHKRQFVKSPDDETRLQSTIRGVEKKALPHMLCVTNMILHGIDTPLGIIHGNTLEKPYRDYGEKDRVPVIATNPPFGGMEQDGIEGNFPTSLRTRETADLFMALIIKLLKNGGRAAVVLPDGFLFGEGVKSTLKQSLIEECNLHTIVRLPNGVFNPYTGIKTNILFFTKGTPTKQTWFYEHPYPPGIISYNKSRPMQFDEFQPEREWWGDESDGFKDRRETKQAWKISAEEIAARGYNLDLQNPHIVERESYDLDELLETYSTQQTHIQSLRDQLKADLLATLTASTDAEDLNTNWSWLGSHFDTIFTTEASIDLLKQTILRLAVGGRLVDCSALAREGALEDVGDSVGGNGFPKQFQGDQTGEIPFLKVSDMNLPGNEREITTANNWVSSETLKLMRARTHPAGTIIFPKIGGAIATNKRRILSMPAAIDNNCAGQVPKAGINVDWLFLVLSSIDMAQYQAGTSVPALNMKRLSKHPVAIPSEEDQKTIVSKVTDLMALCDSLKAQIASAGETQQHLADTVVRLAVA